MKMDGSLKNRDANMREDEGRGFEAGWAPSASKSFKISPSDPDQTHHLLSPPGTVLNSQYLITHDVGLGTFGRVVRCKDLKTQSSVAVKVIRDIERYVDSAKIEASIISDVNKGGRRGTELCVKLIGTFYHGRHYCLTFEPLGLSLYDLIKGNGYAPLPMELCWSVARDLLDGVGYLHSMNLIHTDLKLENIMLKGEDFFEAGYAGGTVRLPRKAGVKIIDFGGGTYDHEHKGEHVFLVCVLWWYVSVYPYLSIHLSMYLSVAHSLLSISIDLSHA